MSCEFTPEEIARGEYPFPCHNKRGCGGAFCWRVCTKSSVAMKMPRKRVNVATTVTTVYKYSTTITADEIREKFGLPKEARVYFHVPGGGDWANTALDIDAEHPVHVEWEEHAEGEAQTTRTRK